MYITDIPVILPDNDELTFNEAHLGKGLQDGGGCFT